MAKQRPAPPPAQEARAAGYAALIQRYRLEVIPNWHESLVASSGTRRTVALAAGAGGDVVREVYPPAYWPGEALGDQLEFALKYDGTNLAILAILFQRVGPSEMTAYVQSRPTGKYARRLWFLYELLTGERLPHDDVAQGNYVELLDPDLYYTTEPARRARRQRILDNLLGDERFCPTVRRTDALRRFEAADLPGRCRRIVTSYPPALLRRAVSYLYTKETRSSFEIERIRPSATRTARFVALLEMAGREDFCHKQGLTALQNHIADPRFRDADYRTSQNYVGETVAWQRERVHFAGPRPEDLPGLMAGLIAAHGRMGQGGVPAVVHAAAIAYGFVFLHPFEDGNGRIHRFLFHNILARRGFTPEGLVFPISAAMLRSPADYDASLEAFSRPLMSLVEYSLDDEGRMTVRNDTAVWYRHIDMTAQAEALFSFTERAIETDLAEELGFLARYDLARRAIQEVVDLPDRQIDLFIRLCIQNRGRLSAAKRASHFDRLTDEEVARLEEAVQSAYGEGPALA